MKPQQKPIYVRFYSHNSNNPDLKSLDGVYAFQTNKQGTVGFTLRKDATCYSAIPADECHDVALNEDTLLLATYQVMSETRKPFNTILQYGTLRNSPDTYRVGASTKIPVTDLDFSPTTWPTSDDQLLMAAMLQQQYPEHATVLLFLVSLPDDHPLAQGKPFSSNTSSEEQLD